MFSMLSSIIRREVFNHLRPLNQVKVNSQNSQILNKINEKPLIEDILRRLSLSSHNRCNRWWETPVRELATDKEWEEQRLLYAFHKAGGKFRTKRRHPLWSIENPRGQSQMKGIVLKTLIKKPRKPNSGNRKCVLLRLTNGKEKVAFVPGIGHNLQEHSVVLVQNRRVRDVPGLRLRVIRGARDCAHVVKKTQ